MTLQQEVRSLRGDVLRMEKMLHGAAKPVFVDLNLASRLYGFSAETLRGWCNQGKLEGIAHKVMGKWVIKVKAMEQWIEQHEEESIGQISSPTDRRSARLTRRVSLS